MLCFGTLSFAIRFVFVLEVLEASGTGGYDHNFPPEYYDIVFLLYCQMGGDRGRILYAAKYATYTGIIQTLTAWCPNTKCRKENATNNNTINIRVVVLHAAWACHGGLFSCPLQHILDPFQSKCYHNHLRPFRWLDRPYYYNKATALQHREKLFLSTTYQHTNGTELPLNDTH